MGTFLTQLACKIDSREEVVNALIDVIRGRGFKLESKSKVSDVIELKDQYDITQVKNGWVQIFCPDVPDESIPKELSKKLNIPIFQFHIHDGDFWMYQLFSSGELKDQHNPIPDYWKKINEIEMRKWKGNPKILSQMFGVDVSKVAPYLVFWNEKKKSNHKAFPEDQCPIANEWSMIDFQKKIGIDYPDFEKPKTLDIIRLTFEPTTIKKVLSI